MLIVTIRYRVVPSIYYEPSTQVEMSDDVTDQEILDKCNEHLKTIAPDKQIANWFIDNLKNRKNGKS